VFSFPYICLTNETKQQQKKQNKKE